MNSLVSAATLRNWEKLKVDPSKKLTRRANKTMSDRRIVPVEYISDKANLSLCIDLADRILNSGMDKFSCLYALARNLLKRNGLISRDGVPRAHVDAALKEHAFDSVEWLENYCIPTNEYDFLGLMYQCLQIEGHKNQTGAYYTPVKIVRQMLSQIDLSDEKTMLDPCCGSGAFLLQAKCHNPLQLYGIDRDPIAVMICKVNLLIRYKEHVFVPQIYCADFLSENETNFGKTQNISSINFDVVATNPPWGSVQIRCWNFAQHSYSLKDSFSAFVLRSWLQLKPGGDLAFLLPEAVMNVEIHKEIRRFFLEQTRLQNITLFPHKFSGVVTGFVSIHAQKKEPVCLPIPVMDLVDRRELYIDDALSNRNYVFRPVEQRQKDVLCRIKYRCVDSLAGSDWALGIVTGDNKAKLRKAAQVGLEPIYTGKEVGMYALKPATHYLKYDRNELQQAAHESLYRARPKLVYRFISKRLMFAYDDSGALVLNSANVLIPKGIHMPVKVLLALLNSDVYQFVYRSKFNTHKVLKGNLLELKFPKINASTRQKLEVLVDKAIAGEAGIHAQIQPLIYSLFDIPEDEISYIEQMLKIL